MKDFISVYVCPFIIHQQISVYRDGECIYQTKCPLTILDQELADLCKKYSINRIDISGDCVYGNKVKQDFQTVATKFNFNEQVDIYVH